MTQETAECTVRTITVSALMEYYKPEEITGYCRGCSLYDLNWSCPPHAFDTRAYMTRFQQAHIIGITIQMKPFPTQTEAMTHYHHCRHVLNRNLLHYEKEQTGGIALIAGHCEGCTPCSRADGVQCRNPAQCRYSLESLGFKVSDLVEALFGATLQWAGQQDPDCLYLIAGILSDHPLSLPEDLIMQEDGERLP